MRPRQKYRESISLSPPIRRFFSTNNDVVPQIKVIGAHKSDESGIKENWKSDLDFEDENDPGGEVPRTPR